MKLGRRDDFDHSGNACRIRQPFLTFWCCTGECVGPAAAQERGKDTDPERVRVVCPPGPAATRA